MNEVRLEGVGLRLLRRRRRRQRGRLREIKASARMKSFWALRDVDLAVESGESLAILGPRGSGRTSLLRIVAGTLIPDVGRAHVSHPVLPIVGLRRVLVPMFTVRQNAHVLGGLLGLDREQIVDRLPSIVEFAGLAGSLDRHLSSLPGLAKARLAFAVATAVDHPIVLVDDALAVGGRDFEQQAMARLEDMRAQGRTFIVASDNVKEMKSFCDRAVYLKDGSIQDSGSVDDMVRRMRGDRRA